MMLLVELLLIAIAGLGHVFLCVALVNRWHSTALPTWAVGALSGACLVSLLAMPAALFPGGEQTSIAAIADGRLWPLAYLVPCWVAAAYALAARLREIIQRPIHASALLSNHTVTVHPVDTLSTRPVGDWTTAMLSRLPGNEILELNIHEKALSVSHLPPGLDGFRIAHLSDFHMSGKITKAWFQEVVRRTNATEPDVVAITGDLFDCNPCLDWIAETFAQLRARGGVYFVLGNHDLRIDVPLACRRLAEAGLVHLGGRWHAPEIDGEPLLLAGNELPWFAPAADMASYAAAADARRPLKILLAHSPDQLNWARRFDFDLMLAGHTHGGQIRLPLVGPVLSPSRAGTRYAAGTFYQDPTVLHVSRGVSSFTPLRWNCAPELAILELRSGSLTEQPNTEQAVLSGSST